MLIRCHDADDLAARAAALIVQNAQEAIGANGRFTLALAGGSTPEKTYSLLAQPSHIAQIDWARTFIFFGDERFVPPGDPHSNFGMARNTLLAHVPIASDQVFPIPTHAVTAQEAAAQYAQTLSSFFSRSLSGAPPRFDLILLGLGDDGHTASLFPGAATLTENRLWAVSSPPGTLPPPVERITLTYPVLNAARHIVFLVSGGEKSLPLQDILENNASPEVRPAAGIHPHNGDAIWLIDEAAAALLTS